MHLLVRFLTLSTAISSTLSLNLPPTSNALSLHSFNRTAIHTVAAPLNPSFAFQCKRGPFAFFQRIHFDDCYGAANRLPTTTEAGTETGRYA